MSDSPRTEIAVLSNAFEDNNIEEEFVDRKASISGSSDSSSPDDDSWRWKRRRVTPNDRSNDDQIQFSLEVSSESDESPNNSPPDSWSWKRSGKRRRTTSSHSDATPGSPFKHRSTAQKIKKNLQHKYEEVLSSGGEGVLAEIDNNQVERRRISTPEIGTKPNGQRKRREKNPKPKLQYNNSADAENDKRICKDLKQKFEESQDDSLSLDASGSEFHSSQEIE